MAQKFLSIKNYEKFQHFKKGTPPWIKLYRSTLTDRDFMQLPTPCKYIYIGLLILASEGCNKVFNDPSWISHRLAINPSELDLKPLYKSGFLIASESTVYRETISQRREETETETETETEVCGGGLEDFVLTPDLEAWAVKEGITNPGQYVEEFKDYWRSAGGKRKNGQPIKDWPAAFRNRMRMLKDSNKLKTPTMADWMQAWANEETV